MIVLSVDPGSRKCGIAVVSETDGILARKVVPVEELEETAAGFWREFQIDFVAVGGSTGSRRTVELMQRVLQTEVFVVDERHSTERARERYLAEHPPCGWRRLIPLGLQIPPEPYDDYAAVILAENFMADCKKNMQLGRKIGNKVK